MSRFEIKAKDGMARLGRFTTKHGTVQTPLIMPVIHPGKSEITPQNLVSDLGFQMVITNSYIIRSQEKFKDIALEKGVHGLLDFQGPIMTDSGTFQMYYHNLPSEEIDPLDIIEFQRQIGSDVGTILDVFSDPNVKREQVKSDVRLSYERAKNSVHHKGDMLLAGTIQGGVYPELREKSAMNMAQLDFDVYPIGGVVPLMERYRYADVVRAVLAAKKHLPPDRPVHLFGCGHPMLFAQAALVGCDFFDSASYAKFADSGRMLLPTGTVHLDNLTELPCGCPVCSNTTADELKGLKKEKKALQLMKHNLYVTASEIRQVRQAIRDGKLMELAAIRARGHPELLEAFNVMLENSDQFKKLDPVGNTSSILYTGPETSRFPIFARFHQQILSSYPYSSPKTLILVPDLGSNPFSDMMPNLITALRTRNPSDVVLGFVTPIGVVPWELEHVHPAQQCVFPPSLDLTTRANTISRTTDFIQALNPDKVQWVSRNIPLDNIVQTLQEVFHIEILAGVAKAIESIEGYPEGRVDGGRRKLGAVFSFQWRMKPEFLQKSDIELKVSRKTGKIRYIQKDEDILFTLVPTTGLLTPTYKGGRILMTEGISDRYMVAVNEDAAPFVADGKSALAKFITRAHPDLLAGEEVLIVDRETALLATGRTLLSGPEMLAFSRGVAVIPRHSRE